MVIKQAVLHLQAGACHCEAGNVAFRALIIANTKRQLVDPASPGLQTNNRFCALQTLSSFGRGGCVASVVLSLAAGCAVVTYAGQLWWQTLLLPPSDVRGAGIESDL